MEKVIDLVMRTYGMMVNLTPEEEQARNLDFQQTGGRLRLRVPEFLVYGVVRIQLSKSDGP